MPRLSRIMSTATAGYAVYALAKPRHLGAAIHSDPAHRQRYDLVAQTFGVRDLAVSAAALVGSPRVVRAAMLIRVALDLGDGALLAATTPDASARQKVLAVTGGWALLNTVALLADRRSSAR